MLAQSYLIKAKKRLPALKVLLEEEAYSDVVREAQEIVELSLKGMLRAVGVEPPKWPDVGGLILEYRDKFVEEVACQAERIAQISKRLRRERELSFYGEVDFIPTESYTKEDALLAYEEAQEVVTLAEKVIPLNEKP
jgi:HEPN domain-containing protein